jgi:glycosyltransferase involved in cell wall biosynthesis
MTRVFHLLTGEYPPEAGGVGDYTELVARGLADRGCEVHVWCPGVTDSKDDAAVLMHRLPDFFGAASRLALECAVAATPGCVLLQYVPNALGRRGINLRFCLWLRRLGRHEDVRVMFHEPYFYFAWQRPWRNVLAVAQRAMAAVLMQAGSVAYFSTASWHRYLAGSHNHPRIVVTPIPATTATEADPVAVGKWRALFMGSMGPRAIVGHFGSYGDHVATGLTPVISAILRAHPTVRLVCLGRGSEAFTEDKPRDWQDRVLGTGALSRLDLAAAVRACDVMVQPYPDGVTTRRTSVMAALANGVATVTTSGALTEDVWTERQAVALARAGRPVEIAAEVVRLVRDPAERRALAERGRLTYEAEFAIERTIDALLQSRPEPVGA